MFRELPSLSPITLTLFCLLGERYDFGSTTFNRGELKKTGTWAQSGYGKHKPETNEPAGSILPQ